MGLFGAVTDVVVGGGKAHTCPTMIKLGTVIPYPQKIYESCDTPLEFCTHQHFFTGNQGILPYQEMQM